MILKIEIENNLNPQNLRKIEKPPKQLYILGNENILDEKGIAIVGTRKCTNYGKNMTQFFAKQLISYGLNIISGMAIGIDTIAHKTAIDLNYKTIAVLPSGFNNIYPKENEKLVDKIIENGGCVVSEYEPNIKPDSKNFLERNRIVSGLSIGTLIIEGGYRSGTSVTARMTKQQGKPVFCVPSSLENKKGIITNNLIKQGNFLVCNAEDIIEQYPQYEWKKQELYKDNNIEEDEKFGEIYKIIKNEPISINEIVRIAKLNINEINYQLMILEMEDKIIQLPGKKFKRK